VSRSDYFEWRSASQPGASQPGASQATFGRAFRNFLKALLNYLIAPGTLLSDRDPSPVVAVPADALLRVYGICADMQQEYQLNGTEDALFVEVTRLMGRSRDALCFGNGVILPLQALREGQEVKVLYRSWSESMEPALEPYQLGI